MACHGGNQPAAGFDLTSYATQDSVIGDQRRWNLVLARLKAGEMPPSQSRQQPTRGPAAVRHRLDRGDQRGRCEAPSQRSGHRARAPVEQRRVRLHHPRPDRRRHPADEGVPRRSRQPGGLRQLGRIAGDVAGAGEEVPRRRPRSSRTTSCSCPSGFVVRAVSGRDRPGPRQVRRQPDRRFLQAPAARLRRLLPRRVAVSPPRGAAPAADDAGGCGRRARRSARRI